MIFCNMKKFYISIVVLAAVLFSFAVEAWSAPRKIPTIAVLSDTSHRNGTNYLVCGAVSDIIGADIINRLNQTGRIKAPLLGDNMSAITQRNIPLYYVTFFKEYKYNYNVDFVNLRRLTRNINADYILMVTSGLDIQSQFLKETWWNKWGISASEPVVPTYKLTTMLTLIDKRTYNVVWQDLYLRDIKADNLDLGIVQFSPSYAQLAKIKKYSNTMSEYVVNNIDRVVNPWIVPPEEPKSVEMRSRFLNEGTKVYYPAVNGEVVKQNFNEFKTETQMRIENHKRQRMQKKHIENVRRLEQKQKEQEVQQVKSKQQKEAKKKNDERLFDSIRNNIDDVTNTLPPPSQEETNIKPAVEVVPAESKDEPKIITPVMNRPSESRMIEVKPAVNVQPQKTVPQAAPKEIKQTPQETPQNHVPLYDWNLKNIYLEKIGRLSNLN